jgi:DNA-binding LacI/PurR family transcriptional regulator
VPKVTQATIAKIHGVSRQAVGSALGLYTNSNIKLSPGTREKIRRTAEELGYRPNRLAQLISGRPSGVIGVLNFGGVGQMSAQNALAVANAVHAAGYQLTLYDVTWYEDSDIGNVVTSLIDFKVEGIILISPTDWLPSSAIEAIKLSETPVVSLGGGVQLEGIPLVESDYEGDAFLLTSKLLDAGFQSLLFLTDYIANIKGNGNRNPRLHRMEGFRRALVERGGLVSNSPLANGNSGLRGEVYAASLPSDWTDPYQIGEHAMQHILARRDLPEVVICTNDDWAIGAMKACGEAGIRIPQDIALAGNDGILISGYGMVPLTTIRLSLDELASEAMSMLLGLIRGEITPAPSEVKKVPGKLLWRASTKRAAA